MAKHYTGRRLGISVGRLSYLPRSRVMAYRWHVCVMVRGWFVAARWV